MVRASDALRVTSVWPELPIIVWYVRSIAHQASGQDAFAKIVNRGNSVARRHRHDLLAAAHEEGITANLERIGTLRHERRRSQRAVDDGACALFEKCSRAQCGIQRQVTEVGAVVPFAVNLVCG